MHLSLRMPTIMLWLTSVRRALSVHKFCPLLLLFSQAIPYPLGNTYISPLPVSGSRKIARNLLCAPDQPYVKKKHGGYFGLYKNFLSEAGETWDFFKYDGFVITGSRYDAFGSDVWILKFCLLLQTLKAMGIKLLGICFGHQILCRALGGTIGRNSAGWDLGSRKITVSDKLLAKYSGLKIPSMISIIECHQDKVYVVPLGAEILASSLKTEIEMFSLGDNVLGIQGHPEYTSGILFSLMDGLLNKNLIPKKMNDEAKASLRKSQPYSKLWQKICKSFLKE